VSERSQDDPCLRNAERSRTEASYLIHRPLGANAWILSSARNDQGLGRYRTLPVGTGHDSAASHTKVVSPHAEDQFVDAAHER
jgi:hypothetical protein